VHGSHAEKKPLTSLTRHSFSVARRLDKITFASCRSDDGMENYLQLGWEHGEGDRLVAGSAAWGRVSVTAVLSWRGGADVLISCASRRRSCKQHGSAKDIAKSRPRGGAFDDGRSIGDKSITTNKSRVL
jgi:hypothetical protein